MFAFKFQDGSSALILASEDGHSKIVKYLIEAKASLDLQKQVYCACYNFYIIKRECSFAET